MAEAIGPYLQLAYLNHGYRFFAPNPGPSHLVRYELVMPDGSVKAGQFPDLREHWPRLLYHRYFMLSESIFNVTQPFVETPAEGFADDRQRQNYLRDKERAFVLVRSVAGDLLRRHGAERVRLFMRVHLIPAPWDVEKGMSITDERLYEERLLGEYGSEDL